MGKPGSPATVQRLVEEHYASLYRFAYRLSGSSADAEDLTQETYCKAQGRLAQLRDPDKARGWLFSILRRAFLLRVRSDQGEGRVSLDLVGDVAEALPEPLPAIDSEQLQQALNELPEVYRTPIIMYYFEEFGYREIAEEMKVPIGTVMSRLSRAKAHLRARLLPAEVVVGANGAALRRANDGL
ncbi:MAG: RNA polymerase sigma factor [Gemmataceae bacterium]